LISKPTTEYFVANNLANGNPTYPKPITAIFIYRELKILRDKWYPNNKKIIPTNLKLTPIILRQWYIGDGSLARYNRSNKIIPQVRLFTYAYTNTEVDYLIKEFKKINIQANKLIAKPRINGGSGPFIYIKSKSVLRFFQYIKDCPKDIKEIYGYKWPTPDEYNLIKYKNKIENLAKKTYKNKKWLNNKYWVKRLSLSEIAKICSTSKSNIVTNMKKFNIKRRIKSCHHSI
jgi:hypothetical protein